MMKIAKKSGVDRETLRLFWHASLQNDRRQLLATLLFPIGTIFLSTVAPLFIGKMLATLGHNSQATNRYLVYFGIAALIGFLGNRYGFQAFLRYQAQTMSRLQARGLDMLLKRSLAFHNNNVGGKLVSDASDFASGFAQFANTAYAQMVPFIIVMISGTILIFWESWLLGLVILLMIGLTVGSGIYESYRRSGLRKIRLEATKKLTSHLADTIVNVQTVKTFAREGDEMAEHQRLSNILLDMRVRDWARAATNGSNRIAVLMLSQVLFVVAVMHLIRHNPDLLGIGIFAFSFTITISNRLFDINNMIRAIEDGLLLSSPMTEHLLQDIEIKDQRHAKTIRITDGAIRFQDVQFQYKDSKIEQAVFENLQLDIKPGEKIGLVGPSGGGKSTLTRLLLRFEDIDAGSITIDGQDIAAVTQASLRQSIAYVPQEPLLFHRPVSENITYGLPAASDKQILAAAQAAHADDFIRELPDGYNTIVGERGVKLSGGQRQRVAIARAILKNAPILVLDEATSALDSESEAFIQDALWRLMQDRTAIVIAHRLSTIQKMDRIVVLEHGSIVEQGTHSQLLRRKGTYAKLWARQSGGFLED
jgi:ATP-binding cassette subfamily B protein